MVEKNSFPTKIGLKIITVKFKSFCNALIMGLDNEDEASSTEEEILKKTLEDRF